MSNSLQEIPKSHENKAYLLSGNLTDVVAKINKKGFNDLYIDGGTVISNFLKEDLIDELILTTIPILLGGGASLFKELPKELKFKLVDTKVYLNQITQNHYKRER